MRVGAPNANAALPDLGRLSLNVGVPRNVNNDSSSLRDLVERGKRLGERRSELRNRLKSAVKREKNAKGENLRIAKIALEDAKKAMEDAAPELDEESRALMSAHDWNSAKELVLWEQKRLDARVQDTIRTRTKWLGRWSYERKLEVEQEIEKLFEEAKKENKLYLLQLLLPAMGSIRGNLDMYTEMLPMLFENLKKKPVGHTQHQKYVASTDLINALTKTAMDTNSTDLLNKIREQLRLLRENVNVPHLEIVTRDTANRRAQLQTFTVDDLRKKLSTAEKSRDLELILDLLSIEKDGFRPVPSTFGNIGSFLIHLRTNAFTDKMYDKSQLPALSIIEKLAACSENQLDKGESFLRLVRSVVTVVQLWHTVLKDTSMDVKEEALKITLRLVNIAMMKRTDSDWSRFLVEFKETGEKLPNANELNQMGQQALYKWLHEP